MKSDITRRAAISGLAVLPALGQTLLPTLVQAQGTQGAPLASWNDGPAKQAIMDFVRATTDQASTATARTVISGRKISDPNAAPAAGSQVATSETRRRV
jgi:hypothetical protein